MISDGCLSIGALASRSWTGSLGVTGASVVGPSGAAMFVIVDDGAAMFIVVAAARASLSAAACFAMERVVAGPGLSSMSPESKRNRQNKVLRFILSSRGLFFEFPVFSAERRAPMLKLGRFVEISRTR